MIRKSLFALTAALAFGAGVFGATDASAKPKGGFHKVGFGYHHKHFGPRFHGPRFVYRIGVYPAYHCFKVITPRGRLRTVCTY